MGNLYKLKIKYQQILKLKGVFAAAGVVLEKKQTFEKPSNGSTTECVNGLVEIGFWAFYLLFLV